MELFCSVVPPKRLSNMKMMTISDGPSVLIRSIYTVNSDGKLNFTYVMVIGLNIVMVMQR